MAGERVREILAAADERGPVLPAEVVACLGGIADEAVSEHLQARDRL